MNSTSQSFSSSPARVRSSSTAQAAAALAVRDKPRVEALFPQQDKQSPPKAPSRSLSRASRSEPHVSSSFGRAASSQEMAASELSAATTSFIAASLLGEGARSASRSDLGTNDRDVLTTALADAAASSSPGPSKKEQNEFQASLPYRTEIESSVVSDWRGHYQKELGKSVALQRGLRFVDLRYNTANSAGVCVLKSSDDVPKVSGIGSTGGKFGPLAQKEFIIDAVTRQLAQMGVVLTDSHHHGQQAGATAQAPLPDVGSNSSKLRQTQTSSLKAESSLGRRAGSEASIGSHHKNLCQSIARDRFQQYIIGKPRKGHRHCTPQLPNRGPAVEAAMKP